MLVKLFLWHLRFSWSSLFIKRIITNLKDVHPFDCTAFVVSAWEDKDPVNRFNHVSGVAIVTSTGHPMSVRNRCVIEILVAFCVATLLFGVSVGVRVFVKGLSQMSSLFSGS